jgi:hypothetical protein
MLPEKNGPKCPSFPTPGPTSRGHPHKPDPGGGDDNEGGGSGGGRRPPAGGDPGDQGCPQVQVNMSDLHESLMGRLMKTRIYRFDFFQFPITHKSESHESES